MKLWLLIGLIASMAILTGCDSPSDAVYRFCKDKGFDVAFGCDSSNSICSLNAHKIVCANEGLFKYKNKTLYHVAIVYQENCLEYDVFENCVDNNIRYYVIER